MKALHVFNNMAWKSRWWYGERTHAHGIADRALAIDCRHRSCYPDTLMMSVACCSERLSRNISKKGLRRQRERGAGGGDWGVGVFFFLYCQLYRCAGVLFKLGVGLWGEAGLI